jgi:integrase
VADRYLRNDDEITRFLSAARREGQMAFMLCATALYTGMRAGELGGLEHGDIDFDKRLIAVQRSFSGPTKSGDVRYVPVVDALLPLLREWRLRNPGRLVFSNRDGEMLRESGRLYQEVFHRILDAAEFPKEEKSNGHVRRYITFHGLRHSFASHWVMNGGDIFKLQKVLGHKSIQMTMRYAHLAPHAFTEDWGRFGPAPTNAAEVIPLARRRRA